MAIFLWRSWPRARELDPTDRLAVTRSVHKGEPIDDPRLAQDVIGLVGVVRRHQERDENYSWILWIFAALALALAVASTVNGDVREAAVWWALVAFWAGMLVWLPRKRAQVLANASHAEDGARALLHQAPPT
jgi:hypothetical protein